MGDVGGSLYSTKGHEGLKKISIEGPYESSHFLRVKEETMRRALCLAFVYFLLSIPSYSGPQGMMGVIEAEAATEPAVSVQEGQSPASFGSSYRDPATGMEFVFIKGGCFEMGDTFGEGEPDEQPPHEVCVGDFYLGKYEVTVGQFRKFVQATGYQTEAEKGLLTLRLWTPGGWKKDPTWNWQNPGFPQTDRHPLVNVSYEDARAFADWLSHATGKIFRLPTEAEWEYAARSGGAKERWAGVDAESELEEYAWFAANSEWRTHPVGEKKGNGLGLHDMSGNAWEWVADCYDERYYRESPKDNPQGASAGSHSLRGGSCFHEAWFIRATDRVQDRREWQVVGRGFRLALTP
jgi:formylglycine-generating enzyme required for sulfatase activity